MAPSGTRNRSSPNKNAPTPSQVISNQLLNGDTSQQGVGLPPQSVDLNVSEIIVNEATSSAASSTVTVSDKNTSKKTSNGVSHPRSPRRLRSPAKKATIRMQFLDSDSEDEGANFSALKAFYKDLNAVEHSSLLQLYRKC